MDSSALDKHSPHAADGGGAKSLDDGTRGASERTEAAELDDARADRYAAAFRPSWAPLAPERVAERQTPERSHGSDAPRHDPATRDEPLRIPGRVARGRMLLTGLASLVAFCALAYWAIKAGTPAPGAIAPPLKNTRPRVESTVSPARIEPPSEPVQHASLAAPAEPEAVALPDAPAPPERAEAQAIPPAEPASVAAPAAPAAPAVPAPSASPPQATVAAAVPAPKPAPKAATAPAVTAAPAEPTPAPSPSTPLLAVRALPEDAVIWLDGQRMSNPFDMHLPYGSKHRIEARSIGYEMSAQTVRLESDATLTISLRRVSGPGPQQVPKQPEPHARGAGFVTTNPY